MAHSLIPITINLGTYYTSETLFLNSERGKEFIVFTYMIIIFFFPMITFLGYKIAPRFTYNLSKDK